LIAILAAFAPGSTASAQAPVPAPLAALQQSVSQRTAEWNALASNLEQRVVRLLPCDPLARAAIEETHRAADARAVALTSYWTAASLQSKTQVEAIRELLAKEEDRAGDWAAEANQARADGAFAAAQAAAFASGVAQVPALAKPRQDLEAIARQYRLLETQAQERAAGARGLLDDLRELLNTSLERQAAIDQRLKTADVEGQRWSAYYAARQARAQIECSLINPAGSAAPAAVPSPAPQGKKP
jgi:hypothetical protein